MGRRLRAAAVAVALLTVSACATPVVYSATNTSGVDVVIRVTGRDGRIGLWWAAAGSVGRLTADALNGFEPVRVETLAYPACTAVADGVIADAVSSGRTLAGISFEETKADEPALPVTSRCST